MGEGIENKIEPNLERECWDIVCSFLESKKTYKAEDLDTKEINARKFKVLRKLDLSISNINDEYFKQIMTSIRNIRLHSLDFHGNEVISLKRLSHWLIKNKSLLELNLRIFLRSTSGGNELEDAKEEDGDDGTVLDARPHEQSTSHHEHRRVRHHHNRRLKIK